MRHQVQTLIREEASLHSSKHQPRFASRVAVTTYSHLAAGGIQAV
jgi:hypothetical protein